MKARRALIILLAILVLSTSLFVGCTKNNEETSNESTNSKTDTNKNNDSKTNTNNGKTEKDNDDNSQKESDKLSFPLEEQVELYFVTSKHPLSSDFSTLEFFDIMEKETNVKIKWEDIPSSQYLEKKNLILTAAADLPDAFFAASSLNTTDIVTYSNQGIFIPLDDLIEEYAPNLQTAMKNDPAIKPLITSPDGHIYALPEMRTLDLWLSPGMLYMNNIWLDKMGKEVPTTADEFYEYLKTFKETDMNGNGDKNDEIPLTFVFDNNASGIGPLFGLFGRADWVNHTFVENGKVVYSAIEEEWKEAIIYFHKLVDEGLIDRESFTQNNNQFKAKIQDENDIVGTWFSWAPSSSAGTSRAHIAEFVPCMEGPNGDKVWLKAMWNNQGKNITGFTITSECEYPEIAMMWVDLIYERDRSIESIYGTIGNILEEDENGTLQMQYDKAPEGVTWAEYFRRFVPGSSPSIIASEEYGTRLAWMEVDKLKTEQIHNGYLDYMTSETYPKIYYTLEETNTINEIEPDVLSYIKQMKADWMLNGGIEDGWDEYLNQLKKLRIDDLIAAYQSAYDRYLQAK